VSKRIRCREVCNLIIIWKFEITSVLACNSTYYITLIAFLPTQITDCKGGANVHLILQRGGLSFRPLLNVKRSPPYIYTNIT